MVSPNEETENGDRDRRERDELIAKDLLSREVRDQFAYHTHARKDHDVDGRMRIEPEQVLEQNRVAAYGWIEDADPDEPLDREHEYRDRDHRRTEDHHKARSVLCPNEQRQPKPRHPGSTHGVHGDDEVKAGK